MGALPLVLRREDKAMVDPTAWVQDADGVPYQALELFRMLDSSPDALLYAKHRLLQQVRRR